MKESDNPLTRSIGSFCAALPYRSATIWLITKVIRFSQTFPIRSIYPPLPSPPRGGATKWQPLSMEYYLRMKCPKTQSQTIRETFLQPCTLHLIMCKITSNHLYISYISHHIVSIMLTQEKLSSNYRARFRSLGYLFQKQFSFLITKTSSICSQIEPLKH